MTGTGKCADTSCHQVEGTFILFPDGDLTRNADERLKLRLLEGRADIDRCALGRNESAVNALGKAKRQTGIIGQRRRCIEPDRLHILLDHPRLQAA